MSAGLMPASFMLINSRPVLVLGRCTDSMPVSISTSLSPVLITSAFWSSTTLSVGMNLVGDHLVDLGLGRPAERAVGSADRQRPVRDHGAFEAAVLEAVEGRRSGVEHRRTGERRRRHGIGERTGRGHSRGAGQKLAAGEIERLPIGSEDRCGHASFLLSARTRGDACETDPMPVGGVWPSVCAALD